MANEYAIERTDAFEHPSVRHPMWLGEHAVFLGLVALAAAQSIDESDHPVAVGVGAAALVGWYALGVLSARMLHTKASTLFWLTEIGRAHV